MKAHIAIAELANSLEDRDRAIRCAVDASRGLRRYLDTDLIGLWHETIDNTGNAVAAPAKASSLYHIVCAIREIDRFIERHEFNGD